jgi:phosphate-selective porin OprO/OprP
MLKIMKSNLNLAIKTALFGGAMLTASSAFSADKELLETLLSNGSINDAQYNKLVDSKETKKAASSDVKISLNKKGFRISSADDAFKLKIGGRIHIQSGYHVGADDLPHTEGTEFRRARIHFKGVLFNDFKYVSEFDFADNKVTIKDLNVSYRGLDWLQITVGNQKQNMSMELQESSNDIMFIERSAVNSLTEKTFNRAIGLNFKSAGKDWSAQLGIYGDGASENKEPGDEGWGISSRVSYTPINTKTHVLHTGASVGYRGMDSGEVKLGYETTHMSNLYLTKAGVTDVSDMTMAIAELGYMYGPFSVQSEYAHMWLARNADTGVNFDAWYIQAGWTLTGESRSYKGSDGEFKRLKPSEEFGFGEGSGWGAVELAIRYDESDLNSGDIIGGAEKAFTLGANWYLNENIRLMADYRTAFNVSPTEKLVGQDVTGVHAFTARVQLTF